jgi:hypothetical protein
VFFIGTGYRKVRKIKQTGKPQCCGAEHGGTSLNLFGIESSGLTASLAMPSKLVLER